MAESEVSTEKQEASEGKVLEEETDILAKRQHPSATVNDVLLIMLN
jgi:hypothetical protein